MSTVKPLAIIAGVGPGTGSAVSQRFAKSYLVILLARKAESFAPVSSAISAAGGESFGIKTDVTSPASIDKAFAEIAAKFPNRPVAAAVYNVASRVKKPFLEISLEEFDSGWATGGRAPFLFSQKVVPLLLSSTSLPHSPTLIFTGATASIKAYAGSASFATQKFALRALSQSLSREFGPQGVHVAHVVIDGGIDVPWLKGYLEDVEDQKLAPEGIAETYWALHAQHRSAWSWEVDVRPWVEKW